MEERNEGALRAFVYGLSALVTVLVLALLALPERFAVEGMDVSRLPAFHALLNGTTGALLLSGFFLIRRGRVTWHRRVMLTAFTLSALFLVSYLVYHAQAPQAAFGGEGWVRPLYFTVLISHIVLAPVVLPLALFTLIRGLGGDFVRHRRVARWTLPIWLYESVTGVIVYLMMAPYYPH